MDKIEALIAIEDIKRLKARYFRLVDTKQWAELRTLFTDDAKLSFPENAIVDMMPDEWVGLLDAHLNSCVSIHHGHTPEIKVTAPDRASGIWAMEDELFFTPGTGFGDANHIRGAGHYHETYVKQDGQWRFSSIRLSRIRLDVRMDPLSVD